MHPELTKVLAIAALGAAGALSRYWVAGVVQKWSSIEFPFGTFAVNMIGCFLFGFISALSLERDLISARTRAIVLTGFMGAFTTFSTYSYESTELLLSRNYWFATANIAGQTILGLVAIIAGSLLARVL